ncbi:hypothetical protein JCM8097_001754 [Rhodosporidiobolus ruineniae]
MNSATLSRTLRTFARTTHTARRSPSPAVLLPRLLPSAHFTTAAPTRQASDALPWFVDPPAAPAASSSPAAAPLATSPKPTPPPPHLLPALHPLHDHLSASPFFDKDGLTYINARESDPEGSWCDWVVLATLREGRERGIRGAAEGVRTFLAKTPLDLAPLDPSSAPLDAPFSPIPASPIVSGLPPSPSKHARSRARGGPPPTRADQATGWAMVDAGRVVVHVMTREGRATYGRGVEEVWEVVEGEGAREKRAKAEEERRREMEENMESVRREMEAEEAEARRRAA